jgi:hypothetical protein
MKHAFFEIASPCIAQAGLEFMILLLTLPSAEIIVPHHAQWLLSLNDYRVRQVRINPQSAT